MEQVWHALLTNPNVHIHDVCYDATGSIMAICCTGKIVICRRWQEPSSPSLPATSPSYSTHTLFSGRGLAYGGDSLHDDAEKTHGAGGGGPFLHHHRCPDREFVQNNSIQTDNQLLDESEPNQTPAERGKIIMDASHTKQWNIEYILEGAHEGPVNRAAWPPVEYENLLASCGADRTVGIWCKVKEEADCWEANGNGRPGTFRWENRCKIRDFKRSVSAVCFWDSGQELRLAACSADESIRVYQLDDATTYRIWTLGHQFSLLSPTPPSSAFTCASQSGTARPALPVEGGSPAIAVRHVVEREDVFLAALASCGFLYIWGMRACDLVGGWQLLQLSAEPGHRLGGQDVEWCPCLARHFDLLATCGEAPSVVLWRWDAGPEDEKITPSRHSPTPTFSSFPSVPSPSTPLPSCHSVDSGFFGGRGGSGEGMGRGSRLGGDVEADSPRFSVSGGAVRAFGPGNRFANLKGCSLGTRLGVRGGPRYGFIETEPIYATVANWGTLMKLQVLNSSTSPCWRVSWNAAGTLLAAASDEKVHIWRQHVLTKRWLAQSTMQVAES